MRDSWIDKKELEELVGGFSPARGKSRRRRHDSLGSAGELGQGEGGGDRPEESTREQRTKRVTGIPESGAELNQYVRSEDPPRLKGVPPEEGAVIGMEAHAGVPFPEILGTSAPGGYFPQEREDSESWEIESQFQPFELIEGPQSFDDAIIGAIDIGMEADLEANMPFEPEPTNSVRSKGVVSNLIVEDASDEGKHSRKIPSFLGGLSESPEARQQPISVRDADRAHTALAEARAKVDESRLLWTTLQETLGSTSIETEAETVPESGHVDHVSKVDEGEETGCEAGRYLYARLENFKDLVQRELGATVVAVCDEDGLLLCKSAGLDQDRVLQNSLLLFVSGRINALIGLDRDGVSQLTDGGGTWRCLIRGEGYQGAVFAGLTLREPLDQDEIEYWRNALVDTSAPSRSIS